MHFITGLSLLAALAETSSASPVKRTSTVDITFIGAANAQFSQNFPTDGSTVSICMLKTYHLIGSIWEESNMIKPTH